MIDKTLTYRIPAHDFERVTAHTSRLVRGGGTYKYTQREVASETYTVRNAEFVVEIDVAKIIDHMVARAKGTKALKSNTYGKLIRCRATKVKQISQRVEDIPLRAGHTLVEEGK